MTVETILSVTAFSGRKFTAEKGKQTPATRTSKYTDTTVTADGFEIKTDKQTIELYCESDSKCCENYGYLMSEDDFSEFIGSNLLSVTVTDTSLKVVELPVEEMDDTSIVYIDIETTVGKLQFTAYNEHNGYYGHVVGVKSTQLTEWDEI